jgi:hypothetical protein
MVLTSDMKKETNKERIYDMMEKYYGNDTANEEELNYIEEISKSTQATNDVINNMKEYIEKNGKNASEEKKEEYLIDLFKLTKIRMDSNDEYAEKGNIKKLSNMDKINDITSKYFENSDELELATKDEKLKGYIDDLKKLVAKFDESTDVFISWINDAIENDEERKIEIYLNELYDAMEYGFIKKDTEKLIKDLKELNKEAEIDYDGYNIESLVSADKLVLPEGYEYDESLGINNKNSTENQNYISIKVNVKANNKGGNDMNNKDKKDNKTKGKIKPIFRKFKSFFIKEKTDKKERKPKFRKFKKFMLAAGTKISRMPIYIRNKFVSIKDYLEEEISININKDNNTFEPSDIDIDEDVDDNNKNNEKDIEDNQKNTNTNDINETKIDENHNDDTKEIEIEENHNDDVNDNNDEIKLTAGENLKRIAKIRSEIERLQRNKEELKNIENASKFAKEETAKHYDEETKKLENQIKEIVDNNKYTNEAGREISMEERDRFDRLDAVQADIIETIKKQKQINSEFNEAWYGHMGEKVSEDLLKRRATLKNELDIINIKLSLLKQKREEIVAEKPIKWYKAM